MTESAARLAREALAVGEQALPRNSARTSRHDYMQAQLFALLVLRQFFKLDYLGLVALVAQWAELRHALRLRRVPHYSTLCYAERRLVVGAERGKLPRDAGRHPGAEVEQLLHVAADADGEPLSDEAIAFLHSTQDVLRVDEFGDLVVVHWVSSFYFKPH